MIKAGTWVQIHNVVLTPDQRAPQVPEDTSKVPLEMWVKGILLEDAEIGDTVKIRTVTQRVTEGELVVAEPVFTHSFGNYVPEITEIHEMLEEELHGGEA